MELPAGSTTDDWQLTEVMLRSIIRRRGFDLTDIVLAHVAALETSTFGWGGTTRTGMEQLKLYFDSRGHEGRSPYEAPTKVVDGKISQRGMGNGVAMKIAPLAFYGGLEECVAMVGRLTHQDPRAWASAYAVALMIRQDFPSWQLDYIIDKVKRFELSHGIDEDSFHSRLTRLRDSSLLHGPIERLRKEIGVGCICLESVCFAIAVFLRNPTDFRAGVLEAVNSGGDADTTSAMVGAMIGAVVGVEGIPKEWIAFNKDFQKAIQLGEDFYWTIENAY